jgi:dihydropteroate synthase
MTRTRTHWKLRDHALTIGERTLIMGVLNVTPDSFSDGGKYLEPDAAVARALQIEKEGADILDIGAESTRPGSERINAGEELRRLIPVLKKLKGKLGIPISVDTYKAEVAEKGLEHGASAINDISALTWEPDLVKPAIKYDAGLILNHMRGTPETWAKLGPMKDVMGSLLAELEAAIHRAVRGGVDRDRIVIDPGIGFGKRGEQNSEILARLGELQRLLLPVLAAVSRKSFLSQEDPKSLEYATAAAVTTAILNGAAIVRVHDVAAMKPVIQTADAIVAATPEREEKAKPSVKPRLDADIQAERRSRPVRPPAPRKEERPVLASPPAASVEAPKPSAAARDEAPDERPRRPFERRTPPAGERPGRRPEVQPERKPFQRRDDERKTQDRPDRRPPERSGPPARQGRTGEGRPYEKRDRPFTPRDERAGDRPDRRPYQRSESPGKTRDQKPYERSGRPPRKADGRDQKPYDRDRRDDRPRKPYQRADSSEGGRSERRPPSGKPYDNRGGSNYGSGRPSAPRDDKRGERPGGGTRPPKGRGDRPFGPKRPGGPPRGGPKKRS